MTVKRRDNMEKAAALAIATTSGTTAASQALQIPPRTVRDWMQRYREGELNDVELEVEVGRLVSEYVSEAAGEMAEAISKAAQLTRRELDRHLARESDQPLKMSELRDLNVSLGIVCDKLAILRGRPESISARYSAHVDMHAHPSLLLPNLLHSDPAGEE